MADQLFNSPSVGNFVWLEHERVDHGPIDGPKTTIPGQNLGIIIATEKPYSTMDQLLYVVEWGSGHKTKHYYKDLFCIGTMSSAKEFLELVAKCTDPVLKQGPRGGFLKFTALIEISGSLRTISYFKEQGTFFRSVIEPVLVGSSRQIHKEVQ